MNRNMLAKFCVAALALTGFSAANACQVTAWTGGATGSPVTGKPGPNDGDPAIRRYSGVCGLRGSAVGQYVGDNTPNAEGAYRVRFYVAPQVTGGEAVVFEALGAANEQRIRVTHDGTSFRFYTGVGSTAGVVAAQTGRWHSVVLEWAAGGNLTYTVQGNNQNTAGATGTIDSARLGFIAAQSGAPVGTVEVDAFDSRRSSTPPKLCRGDADGSGQIQVNDAIRIANEATTVNQAAPNYAPGMPDTNESTAVDVADAIGVSNRAFIANVCTANP